MRTVCVVLTGLLLATPAARAGEKVLKGNWKVSFIERGAALTPWLLKLEHKDGKLKGSVETAKGVPNSTVSDVRLKGDNLTFTIKLGGLRSFEFEFHVGKGAPKKLLGSMQVNPSQIVAARLEATTDTTIEMKPPQPPGPLNYEKAKELIAELLAKSPDTPRAFEAGAVLFRGAKENMASAKDVQEWAETLLNAATRYGPRWQREVSLRVAKDLAAAAGDYPDVAEEFARKAVQDVGPKGGAEAELRALGVLETVLSKLGKKAELKQLAGRVNKLEEEGYRENLKNFPFAPSPVAQRNGSGAVLVELFTGAMCPPCVAADTAFDGLEKTFAPKDVVLLQYHLHIPGPDALTNPDSEARSRYYRDDLRGTPTIFFNGKAEAGGGGPREAAGAKYKEYLGVLKPLLDEKAKATIKAEAVRKGDKIEITARVSGVEKPGEKVKLRMALVQEWARYPGGNGLTYHSRVVRAMPGGPDGFALKGESSKHTATVNLGELRKELKKYLEGQEKRRPFPAALPLHLRDLHVVAFVQDDATRQVLQAVEVAVKE
jgi:hypothetical protein